MEYWIAVVDDEALSLTNARTLLSSNGMRVSCLRSGRDLIRFVEKNDPDLILLDILMPEMDGFETYHALRQFESDHNRPQIPVIFLTGENDSEVERRGLKVGASDFIRKPFDKDILLERINNTVENSKMIESLTEETITDKLTGFLNKSGGEQKTAEMVRSVEGALIVFDLDSFKLVNDLFGHDMGDRVLETFADIVRHNTRAGDVISRIGGDEFMGFFPDIVDEAPIKSLMQRLNEQLFDECRKLMGADFGIPIGISAGAIYVPKHGTEYKSLFRYADASLYRVKQNGKHGYQIYDPSFYISGAIQDLNEEIGRISQIYRERNQIEGALELGQDGFTAVYRHMSRFIRENGKGMTKLMFCVSAGEVGKDISEAVSEFGTLLKKQLHKRDVMTQNGHREFFVLLPEMSGDNVRDLAENILKTWNQSGPHENISIEYAYETVDGSSRE